MAREIAVFVGSEGTTASLYEKGKIIVFQKRQGAWSQLREKAFALSQDQGLKELRAGMAEAVAFLDECKIFVGLSVVGVPYFELEKAGCSVWEFTGAPAEFLDYVLEQEEEAQAQSSKQPANLPPEPVETGNGLYQINLKEIQQNNSGFTSKQVLQPFIQKGNFYQLEVVCSHMPPWLEVQLQNSKLNCVLEKINNNEIKLTITKKTCSEC